MHLNTDSLDFRQHTTLTTEPDGSWLHDEKEVYFQASNDYHNFQKNW